MLTETCDDHTSFGSIIVPASDSGKYTDDSYWVPPEPEEEETESQPDEGSTGTISDGPAEGPGIYLAPGVVIGPQAGPGGA